MVITHMNAAEKAVEKTARRREAYRLLPRLMDVFNAHANEWAGSLTDAQLELIEQIQAFIKVVKK
jgi:hypothetical protein